MKETDELYSVNRLKNELRMKPKDGVEPAALFRSSYNKNHSYPVYKLEDCEHFPKRDMSLKQKEALRKMIISNKLKKFDEKYKQAVEISLSVHNLFKEQFLVLDTETTGLNNHDQIIELSILSSRGEIIYNQRYKPTVPISDGAYRCHGINLHDLENEPSFEVDACEIKRILLNNNIVIFNASYDINILRSTFKAVGMDDSFLDLVETYCAMHASAGIYGSTNKHGTISLANAASFVGFTNPKAHSALGDCITTLAVMRDLRKFHEEIRAKRKELEN